MKIGLFYVFVCLTSFNLTAQWNQANLPPTGTYVPNIKDFNFVNDTLAFGLYAGNCRMIKTTDGGLNWTCLAASNTGPYHNIYFTSSSIGYAVSGNAHKTTNGGASFNQIKSKSHFFELFRDVYFVSNSEGYLVSFYAGGDFGLIHKTTNSGTSWNSDTLYGVDFIGSTYFPSVDTGYIVGGLDNKGVVYHTYNAGSTWTRDSLPQIGELTGLHFINNSIGYAVGVRNGTNEIVKTTNAGQTWSYIAPGGSTGTFANPHTIRDIHFTSLDTGYAVGDSSRAIFTDDSGSTWSSMNLTGDFWKVEFNSQNVGLISGNDSVMLRKGPPVITGIEMQEKPNFKLVIYPNPSKGILTLDVGNDLISANYQIFDIKGSLIREAQFSSNRTSVDLSAFGKGVYFLQIREEGIRKKVVVY